MSMLTLSAKLDRTDNSTSWGFRMHGGKDFCAPLTIQRVAPGSLAAKCGLQVGDTILKIGDAPTEPLKHKEAQQHIQVAGNSLELTLQRGGGYHAPPSQVSTPSYYTTPASPASPPYSPAAPPFSPANNANQNYNIAPKPFVPGGGSTVPVAMNKQYNTPISMYSVDNVMNSLSNKTANMNMGPSQPQPGSNSVATSPQVHEPQSASQHDEFVTKPSVAKFVPPTTNNTAVTKPPAQSARYDDSDGRSSPQYRGYANPQTQSRTFKILQDLVDSGQDYTGQISNPAPTGASDDNGDTNKKLYVPSSTFQMVQDDEIVKSPRRQFTPAAFKPSGAAPVASASPVGGNKPPSASPASQPVVVGALIGSGANHSRTFHILQQQIDSPGGPPASNSWLPKIPTGPRKMKVGRRGEARSMAMATGGRTPICESCSITIRGPFVLALEKSWCPDHFLCSNPNCRQGLIDVGFVEENGQLFCQNDYEQYFAPKCGKCGNAIIGDIINALKNTFHTHCFLCVHCEQSIGTGSFHVEEGKVYCEKDWGALFQTKCHGCQFPIEPGDRWVEALSQNWHSECFNCSTCQVNLEGQSFFAKGGKPYCKKHSSAGRF